MAERDIGQTRGYDANFVHEELHLCEILVRACQRDFHGVSLHLQRQMRMMTGIDYHLQPF